MFLTKSNDGGVPPWAVLLGPVSWSERVGVGVPSPPHPRKGLWFLGDPSIQVRLSLSSSSGGKALTGWSCFLTLLFETRLSWWHNNKATTLSHLPHPQTSPSANSKPLDQFPV